MQEKDTMTIEENMLSTIFKNKNRMEIDDILGGMENGKF